VPDHPETLIFVTFKSDANNLNKRREIFGSKSVKPRKEKSSQFLVERWTVTVKNSRNFWWSDEPWRCFGADEAFTYFWNSAFVFLYAQQIFIEIVSKFFSFRQTQQYLPNDSGATLILETSARYLVEQTICRCSVQRYLHKLVENLTTSWLISLVMTDAFNPRAHSD